MSLMLLCQIVKDSKSPNIDRYKRMEKVGSVKLSASQSVVSTARGTTQRSASERHGLVLKTTFALILVGL